MDEEIFFETGARIAALRGAMKQSVFAERLAVHRNSVLGWESGKRLPDGESLVRMADEFGADINFILTGKTGGVAPSLRPDEQELLDNYRAAPADGRERIRQISATAANSPKRRSAAVAPSQYNTGAGAVQIGGDAKGAAINTGSGVVQSNSQPGAAQVVGNDNVIVRRK